MKKVTVDELFRLLHQEGHFFSVTFERRTNSQRRFQLAGDLRTMLCRTGMQKYTRGLIPPEVRAEEDFRHGILTVWSVNDYNRYRRRGVPEFQAGFDSWRRIDLCGVRALSLVRPKELPPTIHSELHHLTNEWRLQHMPQEA